MVSPEFPQFAAGPALNAPAPPPVGNRQEGRESPLDPGPPGVALRIGHQAYPVQFISVPPALIRDRQVRVKRRSDISHHGIENVSMRNIMRPIDGFPAFFSGADIASGFRF